jgi:uncharacterized protein (DUF1778 family)
MSKPLSSSSLIPVTLELTDEEQRAIEAAAAKEGLTRDAFIRVCNAEMVADYIIDRARKS